MAILESINEAKKRGASSQTIIQEIMRQNPQKKASFDEAFRRGASADQILDEVIKQNNSNQENNLLQKFGNASRSVLEAGGQFFGESASKAIGSPITNAIGSAVSFFNKDKGESIKNLSQQAVFGEDKIPQAKDVLKTSAFAFLELYPGGGALTNTLRKIPGGSVVADGLSNVVKLVPNKLREKAVKQFAEGLGATKEALKVETSRVAPELLNRGVFASSREKLLGKVQGNLERSGSAIGEFLDSVPKEVRIKTKPILEAIEKTKSKFVVDGVPVNDTAVSAANDLQQTVASLGEEISVDSLRRVRQIWDEVVDSTNGFTRDLKDSSKVNVIKEATNSLRKELSKALPDLDKLNAEYTLWKRTEKILKESIKRTSTQTGSKVISSLIGGGAGFASGDSLQDRLSQGVLGAVAFNRFSQLVRSPGWKFISANQKNKIAELLTKDSADIGNLITKLLSGLENNKE